METQKQAGWRDLIYPAEEGCQGGGRTRTHVSQRKKHQNFECGGGKKKPPPPKWFLFIFMSLERDYYTYTSSTNTYISLGFLLSNFIHRKTVVSLAIHLPSRSRSTCKYPSPFCPYLVIGLQSHILRWSYIPKWMDAIGA